MPKMAFFTDAYINGWFKMANKLSRDISALQSFSAAATSRPSDSWNTLVMPAEKYHSQERQYFVQGHIWKQWFLVNINTRRTLGFCRISCGMTPSWKLLKNLNGHRIFDENIYKFVVTYVPTDGLTPSGAGPSAWPKCVSRDDQMCVPYINGTALEWLLSSHQWPCWIWMFLVN